MQTSALKPATGASRNQLPDVTNPEYREDLETFAQTRGVALPPQHYVDQILADIAAGNLSVRLFGGTQDGGAKGTPVYSEVIRAARSLEMQENSH